MADQLDPPLSPSFRAYAAREEKTRQLLVEAAASAPIRKRRLQERAAILNQSMALGVARPYHGRGVEAEDVDQVALMGLWKAVLGYTPGPTTTTFAAYAIPTITGEVKRYFRDHGWLVRPARTVQEHSLALNQATNALRHRLGREPRDEELAEYLDISTVELDQARLAQLGYHGRSIEMPLPGTTHTVAEALPDRNDEYDLVDATMTLRQAIAQLPDRDRVLLRLRCTMELTQSDIGQELGISQMHVSRLLRRLHTKLQDCLMDQAS